MTADQKSQASVASGGSQTPDLAGALTPASVLGAVVTVLVVPIIGGVFLMWSTASQVEAAREQLTEQHRQVLEQLAAQQLFSRDLQRQQHELALRQIEAQDKFTRDQLMIAEAAEERREKQRIEESRISECLLTREKEQTIRSSLYRDFHGASARLVNSYILSAYVQFVDEAMKRITTEVDFTEITAFNPDEWEQMKDIAQLTVWAQQQRHEGVEASGQMQSILLQISANFPQEVAPLTMAVELALLPTKSSESWTKVNAIMTDRKLTFDERKNAAMKTSEEIYQTEQLPTMMAYREATLELTLAMAKVLTAPGGCS